jgi:hypothetical protein
MISVPSFFEREHSLWKDRRCHAHDLGSPIPRTRERRLCSVNFDAYTSECTYPSRYKTAMFGYRCRPTVSKVLRPGSRRPKSPAIFSKSGSALRSPKNAPRRTVPGTTISAISSISSVKYRPRATATSSASGTVYFKVYFVHLSLDRRKTRWHYQ